MIDIDAYLKRLDDRGNCEPTLETLRRLQRAHLTHIPYENIDLLFRRACSLAPEALFDKLITRRRGGYCFELNGLFGELLRNLGFRVTEYFGRWHFGDTTGVVPMRRHRILMVEFADGQRWIADAGIGTICPLEPLCFVHGEEQFREVRPYRIVEHPVLGHLVETDTGAGYVPFFSFTLDPHLPQDFEYVHYYCGHHPDSIFLREAKVHLFTPFGRNSVSDEVDESGGTVRRMFRIAEAGGTTRTFAVADDAEFTAQLEACFGIRL